MSRLSICSFGLVAISMLISGQALARKLAPRTVQGRQALVQFQAHANRLAPLAHQQGKGFIVQRAGQLVQTSHVKTGDQDPLLVIKGQFDNKGSRRWRADVLAMDPAGKLFVSQKGLRGPIQSLKSLHPARVMRGRYIGASLGGLVDALAASAGVKAASTTLVKAESNYRTELKRDIGRWKRQQQNQIVEQSHTAVSGLLRDLGLSPQRLSKAQVRKTIVQDGYLIVAEQAAPELDGKYDPWGGTFRNSKRALAVTQQGKLAVMERSDGSWGQIGYSMKQSNLSAAEAVATFPGLNVQSSVAKAFGLR